MADERFDELTKRLVGPLSRRGMLKAVLAAAAASIIVAIGDDDASASGKRQHGPYSPIACYKKGRFCAKNSQCCSNHCTKKGARRRCA